MSLIFAAVFAGSCLLAAGFSPVDHLIKDLPGWSGSLSFNQYSGYVKVSEEGNRNLFYWFVESQRSPSTDPLVVWMNGGPGCSSLGGFFTEQGPFRPHKNLSLTANPYAWNRVANVIFLESPAGVGFSFASSKGPYTDKQSAADVVSFLAKFVEMYPTFNKRELFISGESYGGHYVPTTAQAILENNAHGPYPAINLAGILVGNPWTDPENDNHGIVQTWFGYNLITSETMMGIYQNCNFTNMLPIKNEFMLEKISADPKKCQDFLSIAGKQNGNLNPYDIYSGVCVSQINSGRALLEKFASTEVPLSHYAKKIIQALPPSGEDRCIENYATDYLNRKDVQAAIHANPTHWSECNMEINSQYSRQDFTTSMLPVYKYLLKSDIRIIVYSGDVDSVCPTHGSRNWITSLTGDDSLTQSEDWTPWQSSDKQVGGYVTRFNQKFIFTTIHGAGHMVPGTQPLRAFDMYSQFLTGNF